MDEVTQEYTEAEAIEILGVSKITLRQQRHRHSKNPDAYCIPFVRRGRRIFYRHDDLIRHLHGDYVKPENQ